MRLIKRRNLSHGAVPYLQADNKVQSCRLRVGGRILHEPKAGTNNRPEIFCIDLKRRRKKREGPQKIVRGTYSHPTTFLQRLEVVYANDGVNRPIVNNDWRIRQWGSLKEGYAAGTNQCLSMKYWLKSNLALFSGGTFLTSCGGMLVIPEVGGCRTAPVRPSGLRRFPNE